MPTANWLWNWLRDRPPAAYGVDPLAGFANLTVQRLEDRRVLSVSPVSVVGNTLNIDITGADNVVISYDAGMLTIDSLDDGTDQVVAFDPTVNSLSISGDAGIQTVTFVDGPSYLNLVSLTVVDTVDAVTVQTNVNAADSIQIDVTDTILIDAGGHLNANTGSITLEAGNGITMNVGTTLDTGDAVSITSLNGNLQTQEITAGAGITLTATNGSVTSVGLLDAGTTVDIDAESVTINGSIDAVGAISVDASAGSIDVFGSITGNDNISLSSAGTTSNLTIHVGSGVSSTGGDILLSADQTVTISEDVSTTLDGTITVTGNSAAGARNIVIDSDAVVSTVDGNLTLDADQETQVNGTFVGIDISGANTRVQVTGAGDLVMAGRGGDVGANQYGIVIQGGAQVTGGTTGTVMIAGVGGASTDAGNIGVFVNGAGALISSSGAAVDVTGRGGGAGASASNVGVSVLDGGQISAGGNGSIAITGSGGGSTGSGNYGVHLDGLASAITSSSGAITITGIEGNGDSGLAIVVDGSSTISHTADGEITLLGDSINLAGTSTIDAGAGTVAVRQFTDAVAIDLGSASDAIGGPLSLSDAELNRITAGTLVIGNADSGAITVSNAISPANVSTLMLVTGANVIDGTVGEQADITVTNLAITAFSGIGATGDGDLDIAVTNLEAVTDSGDIVISSAGALTIGGVSLALSGVEITGMAVGTIAITADGVFTVNEGVTGTGDVRLTSTGANSQLVVASGAAVSTTGGDIALTADAMDFDAAAVIDAGTNSVTLAAATNGTDIDLGGADAAGVLGLTADELNTITAGVLVIGNANAGSVTISSAIDLTSGSITTLELITGGAIIDGNALGVDITVDSLDLVAGTGIGAGDALEIAVSNLAFRNTASGNVEIDNDGALTITNVGSVDGTLGNELGNFGGGTTVVSAASPITVAADVTSVGSLTFTAGELDDAPGFADDLTINAGVTVSVTGVGETLTLNAGDDVIIDGAVEAADGTVVVTAGFGDLDASGAVELSGSITAFLVTLSSVTGITDAMGAVITASELEILGAGAVILNEEHNVDTLAANLDGALTYNDADGFDIGTAGSTNGITLTAAGSALTLATTAGVIGLDANVTTDGDQDYNSDVELLSAVTLNSGTGNIEFAEDLNGTFALSISGGNDVTFTGDVGLADELAAIDINVTGTVTISGEMQLGQDETHAGTLSVTATTFVLEGSIDTQDADPLGGGGILIVASTIRLVGEITTDEGNVDFDGPVVLIGDVEIQTETGSVAFLDTIDGDAGGENLTVISSAGGVVSTSGAVGGNTAIGTLSFESQGASGTIDISSDITAIGDVGLVAENVLVSGAIDTSGAAAGFGNVVITSTNLTTLAGDITTSDGDININGFTRLDASITLESATGDIFITGFLDSNDLGGAPVDGLTVTATTGLVSILADVGTGATPGSDSDGLAALDITAGTELFVSGTWVIDSPVTFTPDVYLSGDWSLTVNGDVTFEQTVDSDGVAVTTHLTINSQGTTDFQGIVGGQTALTSLTTDAGGSTQLSSAVTTTDLQSYGDDLELTTDATLTSADGGITFAGLIDASAGENLTVNAGAGDVQFLGDVGSMGNFGTLEVTTSGMVLVDGDILSDESVSLSAGDIDLCADITAADGISFTGAVTLTADITLTTTAGDVLFNDTVVTDSVDAWDLTIASTSGNVEFRDTVGATIGAELGAVDITTGGNVELQQRFVTVDDVTISAAKVDIVDIDTSGAAAGLGALTITHTGDLVLNDAVLGDDFEENGGGTTFFDGTIATTDGNVTFVGPVQVVAGVIDTDTGNVTFQGSVDGAMIGALTLDVTSNSGNIDFQAAVGNAVELTDLTTDTDGTTNFGDTLQITGELSINQAAVAPGAVTFIDAVEIGGAATIDGASVAGTSLIADDAVNVTATNGGIAFSGNVTSTSAAIVLESLAGVDVIQVGGNVLAATSVSISSAAGNIDIDGTVTATANEIDMQAATGLDVAGAIEAGTTVDLSTNTGDVVLGASVTANDGDITLVSTSGNVSVTGAISASRLLAATASLSITAGGTVDLFATTNVDDDVLLANGGLLTIHDGAHVTAGGMFQQTGGGNVDLGADLDTGGLVSFAENVVLTADVTITSLTGGVTFSGTVDADGSNGPLAEGLTVDAGVGNVLFADAVGSATPLEFLTVTTSANINADATLETTGAIDLTAVLVTLADSATAGADGILITGDLATAGDLLSDNGPITVTGNVTLTGDVRFDSDIDDLGADTTSDVLITGTIDIATFTLTIDAGTGGDIELQGAVSGTGDLVVEEGDQQTYAAISVNDLTIHDATTSIIFTAPVVATTNGLDIGDILVCSSGTLEIQSTLTADGTVTLKADGGVLLCNDLTVADITFESAVVLCDDVTITATGDVVFESTVDSEANQAYSLFVDANGLTDFQGHVGGGLNQALGNLSTDADGTTQIGGHVTTTGDQFYLDAVTLTADVTLTGVDGNATGEAIEFGSTLAGGGFDLTIAGGGAFAAAVSGVDVFLADRIDTEATFAAGSVNVTGTSDLGDDVTTTGTQTYGGAVLLTGAAVVSSSGVGANGDIQFQSTVNGAFDLTVTTSGTTTFGGNVGGGTALTSLMVDGGGTTVINTPTITAGVVDISDDVTLLQSTTVTGTIAGVPVGSVNFGGAITGQTGIESLSVVSDGAASFSGVISNLDDFTVNAAGLTTFAGNINIAGDLATTGGDITRIDTASITAGTVNFSDAVELSDDLAITAGAITFGSRLNEAALATGSDLTLTIANPNLAAGDITFTGAVGGTTALDSLTITAANDVTFSSTVRLVGDLDQQSGTGTTAFQGTSGTGIGGQLLVTTNEVTFSTSDVVTVGAVVIAAQNNILFNAGAGLNAGAATITLRANQDGLGDQCLSQASGTIIQTTNETALAVVIEVGGTQGDASISDIRAGTTAGVVSITAGDEIRDNSAGEGANITAHGAALRAGMDIGGTGPDDDIDTAVAELAFSTAGGGVEISNQGDLTLTAVDGLATSLAGGGGTLFASGSLTVAMTTQVDGTFHFIAGDDAAAINNLTLSADITHLTGVGEISFVAGDDIIQTAGTIECIGGMGRVNFTADHEASGADGERGGITQTGGNIVAEELQIRSHDSVTLNQSANDTQILAAVVTGAGQSFTYQDANDLTIASIPEVGGVVGLTTSGGDVTLTTGGQLVLGENGEDILAAGATVSINVGNGFREDTDSTITAANLVLLGTGTFTVDQQNNIGILAAGINGTLVYTDVDAFNVGTVLGTSGITTSDDDVKLTAGGDLTLNDDINLGTGDLTLNVTGAVTQTANDDIIAGGLLLFGTGSVTLNNSGNNVTTLAADYNGTIAYTDANGLIIGTVTDDPTGMTASGINTSNDDVKLTVLAGGLTIGDAVGTAGEDDITLGTGNLTLNVVGAVTQIANNNITASGLQLLGSGSVTLNNNDNNVTTLAADYDGTIAYTDANGLIVGTVIDAPSGMTSSGISTSDDDVKLTAGGDLTLNDDIHLGAGDLTLDVTGAVTQTANNDITAGGLQLLGSGTVTLDNSGNNVTTLAADYNGTIAYTNANGLVIGTVTDGPSGMTSSGITTSNDDVKLTVLAGGLTIGDAVGTAGEDDITLGTGNLTLDIVGAVTQTTDNNVTADGLQLLGSGSVTLDNSGNNVTTLAADYNGTIAYTEANGLIVGTVIDAPSGMTSSGITTSNDDVKLTVLAGGLTIGDGIGVAGTDDITLGTGDLTLNVGGAVTQTANNVITAGGLQLLGAGSVTLNEAGNNVATLAATYAGSISYVDADALVIGVVTDNAAPSLMSSTGISTSGGDVSIMAAGDLTVNENISTAPGAGGLITVTGGTINAQLIAGAGDITLTGGNPDLVINVAQTTATTLTLQATRDVIINAVVTTTGLGADVIVTADFDDNGVGGVLVTALGQVVSADAITLTGSDLFATPLSPDSIRIDADGSSLQLLAAGDILLQHQSNAPVDADLVIDGRIRSTGGDITLNARDTIRVTSVIQADAATGDITFQDAVVLTGDLQVTAGGDVTFQSTIDDDGAGATSSDLIVTAAGTTTFQGSVGAVSAIETLTTNGGGATHIGGGLIRTSGVQTYHDAVDLTAHAELQTTAAGATGANITLFGAVDTGGFDLTLDAGTLGDITLHAALTGGGAFTIERGDVQQFAAISVGSIDIQAATTAVTFHGAVNVTNNVSVASDGSITQASTLDAGGDVSYVAGSTILVSQALVAGDAVVLTATNGITLGAFADVMAGAGGITVTGSLVTAADFLTDNGAIVLSGPVTLTGNVLWDSDKNETGGADITVAGTITTNAFDLTIDAGASGDLTLQSAVTGGGDLTIQDGDVQRFEDLVQVDNLTIDDATTSITFVAAVTVANNVSVTSGGSISQQSTLDAGNDVTYLANGAISIQDDLTADSNVTLTSTMSSISITAPVVVGTGNLTASAGTAFSATQTLTAGSQVQISAGTTLTLAESADITAGSGGVNLQAPQIITAAEIDTAGGDVSIVGAVRLTGDVTIDTGATGNLLVDGTIDGTANFAQSLFLSTGSGDITVTGDVGATSSLNELIISDATNVTFAGAISADHLTQQSGLGLTTIVGAVNTFGAAGVQLTTNAIEFAAGTASLDSHGNMIVLTADAITLPTTFTNALGSTVTLQTLSAGTSIGLEDASQDLNFTDAQLDTIHSANLLIGSATQTVGIKVGTDGPVSIDENLTLLTAGVIDINGPWSATAANSILLDAGDDINLTGSVTTISGDLTLSADDDITLGSLAVIQSSSGNVALLADSDLDANGTGGGITMANGAVVNSGTGMLSLQADEDIVIGQLISSNTTAAAITLTSLSGGIVDGGDAGVDIVLTSSTAVVTINAMTGVGSAAGFGDDAAIETRVNQIEITNSAAGEIAIDEFNAIIVLGVNQNGPGAVTLTSGGTMTVIASGTGVQTQGGGITLITIGAASDLVLGATISSNGGDIALTAGDDLSQAVTAPIATAGGDLTITVADAATFAGTVTTMGGDLAATIGGSLMQTASAPISTAGGDVDLKVGGNTTLGGTVATTGGDLSAAVDGTFTLNSQLTTSGGNVELTVGGDANLASVSRILTADGNFSAQVQGAVTMANGAVINTALGTLSLEAGNDVTIGQLITTNATSAALLVRSTGGAIIDGGDAVGPDIIANSSGAVVTIEAANGVGSAAGNGNDAALETQIDTLVLRNSTTGHVQLDEVDGLRILELTQSGTGNVAVNTVGDLLLVAGQPGLTATSGTVTLNATSPTATITIDSRVQTTSGNIVIAAADDIRMGSAALLATQSGQVNLIADADSGANGAGGQIFMANGAVINAGSGDIIARADENITVGRLVTTSLVSLTSTSAGVVDGGDAGGADITANTLVLQTRTGIGSTNTLETAVSLLAANNTTSGAIRINNSTGGLLTIGQVGGVIGVTNTGAAAQAIDIVNNGGIAVNGAVRNATGGNIILTANANGGNDDHLTINAVIAATNGNGDILLTAGDNLIINDSGNGSGVDISVVNGGEILGGAGGDVLIGSDVVIRSATGVVTNTEPVLIDVLTPQISALGIGTITMTVQRPLEIGTLIIIDWGDGTVETFVVTEANQQTLTFTHQYLGPPNPANPAADIPLSVTVLNPSFTSGASPSPTAGTVLVDNAAYVPNIRFSDGGEVLASSDIGELNQTQFTGIFKVPGDGLASFAFDLTPEVVYLDFPQSATPDAALLAVPPPVGQTNVEDDLAGQADDLVSGERVVILEVLGPDGSVLETIVLAEDVLDDIDGVVKSLPDGRYRFLLREPGETQTRLLQVVDVHEGKIADDLNNMLDRPRSLRVPAAAGLDGASLPADALVPENLEPVPQDGADSAMSFGRGQRAWRLAQRVSDWAGDGWEPGNAPLVEGSAEATLPEADGHNSATAAASVANADPIWAGATAVAAISSGQFAVGFSRAARLFRKFGAS